MSAEVIALVVFAAVFAISAIRNVHMGALALVAAFLVGIGVVGESLDDILADFPVDALLILLGITYLFGMARETGTIDWLVDRSVRVVGDRVALLPWAMWLIGTAVACLGTSHAAFAVVPIAMSLATTHRISPTLMGIAMSSAIVGGALAPTSINGITVGTVARTAGIPYDAGLMFFLSVGVNALVVLVAFLMFGGPELVRRSRGAGNGGAGTGGSGSGTASSTGGPAGGGVATATRAETEPAPPLNGLQIGVLATLVLLVVGFFTLTILDVDVNLGVVALTLAVGLSLWNPEVGRKAVSKVDWGTILLLGGILTYVGVLTRLGAIDQLGELARSVNVPLVAAIVLCVIAGLVSAFASTIGILGALIPLAVPLLVVGGGLETTGFIYALAISASLVDCAPFSTTGATIVASASEPERKVLSNRLTVWGFAMVLIGPAFTILTMVVPFLLVS
ncbi:C4-dicarboxylate ABC transporter [Pseudonocardia sp. EC080610-09]|uniref:SLC13 family permease n=1 Tax=unclassified Pseudonocardia TaxID=2619320 RepID=UPI0006CB443C|nr:MULTISPECIES: SLC13 family permease [unclassified Pseudonocardia]ALE73358.1 C4-dicarboxylate ABC transporter [Pseudonocardia sp. EC080625-04]ALL76697.1 C4-dicarboxylate ABC transporter [Pseudonocardia sp. EC080610-09]ALL83725.1 C4-dicarboxylate ABC transporter [Pseudonocardia sp. EC080619-01]